jgi:site-specific recombinase XerD
MMATRLPPKAMAKTLVRVLPSQHPDYYYLKKVFQHTRALLAVVPSHQPKRLPELLTDAELVALYEAIWQARQLSHLVMLKLLLFTGIHHAKLVQLRLTDIDLQTCQVRIAPGKGQKDRAVLFPSSFRGELAQYMERQGAQGQLVQAIVGIGKVLVHARRQFSLGINVASRRLRGSVVVAHAVSSEVRGLWSLPLSATIWAQISALGRVRRTEHARL